VGAAIVFSCDGHRSGQPCRGFYPSREVELWAGWREAQKHGWTYNVTWLRELCPSPNHDEQQP
jgi:hypothetical protein